LEVVDLLNFYSRLAVPSYSVDYFHKNSECEISVVIQLLVQLYDGLVHLFNTIFKYNFLNLLPCACFTRLGGKNDVSRIKRGDGIKKFEKHWSSTTVAASLTLGQGWVVF